MRSSFLTMFSGTAGAGLLSLPAVLSLYGVGMGFLCLILFGLLTHRTYKILNDLILESGRKSYANVCSFYLGKVVLPHRDHGEGHDRLHHRCHDLLWDSLWICW